MGDIRYSRSYDDALNDPLSFKDKFTKTVADYTESEYYNRAWAFFNADEDGNRILPVKDIYRFYDLIKSITTGDGKWQIKYTSGNKYLLNTGNRFVETDGDFSNPSIETVYSFDNGNRNLLWGAFKDYEEYGEDNADVLEMFKRSNIIRETKSGYNAKSSSQQGLSVNSGAGNRNPANANNRRRNVQQNNVNPGYISENISDYNDGTVVLKNGKHYSIWEAHGQYYVQVSTKHIEHGDTIYEAIDEANKILHVGELSGISYSRKDSTGRSLTDAQIKYFADSKIRDEDGNLFVVYHGTDAYFTVFDRTKSRVNMDI